jgi:transcriptional regulator of arginine metabolism
MPDHERGRRERAIIELIQSRPLGTQAELVSALTQSGFEVTQATVSRDIRRLGLVKQPLPGGGYRYSPSLSRRERARPAARRLELAAFVQGFAEVETFLAVRTLPGHAMAVATSIDGMELPSVSGTLAGDDMVLVLIERAEQRENVRSALDEYF